MATRKARASSVNQAKRQAAVNQIVEQLRGAFGDYVRSQVAAQPMAAPPPPGAPVGPPMQTPPPVPPAPGFMPPTMPPAPGMPPQQVVFEDGSTGMVGGGVDPGFAMPAPRPDAGRLALPPQLLAYIQALQGRGVGPTPFDGPPVMPVVLPPGRRV